MTTQLAPVPYHPSLWTDGGCIKSNPSQIGITWAWVRVEHGNVVGQQSGWIDASTLPGGEGTNNQAEFFAVLRAFEALENNEIVRVFCDSQVTVKRWTQSAAVRGIPQDWYFRMGLALRRSGGSSWYDVDGHPTLAELETGRCDRVRRNHDESHVVSEYNVMVDRMCRVQAILSELVILDRTSQGA